MTALIQLTARASELQSFMKKERKFTISSMHFAKPPIRISRNKTATVTKLLEEKNAFLRDKRHPLAGNRQD